MQPPHHGVPIPHAEARPLRFAQLLPPQENALIGLVEKIKQVSMALRSRPTLHRAFDDQRTSQVLFLEGERGSSKTSILVTLYKLFTDPEANEWFFQGSGKMPIPDQLSKRALGELAKNVIWMPTLELEPLPRSTNLLVAILARLMAVLEPKDRQSRSGSHQLGPTTRMGSPSFQEVLHQLMVDTVLAWGGSSNQHLADPVPLQVSWTEG